MAEKKIAVRVLVAIVIDGVTYQPNTVIELDTKTVKSLVASNQVDDNKESVAYALTLGDLVTPELQAESSDSTQIKPLEDGADESNQLSST